MSRFGEKIRILRERRGLTVRDVAKAVGLSYGHISKMERGERRPSIYIIADLSRYFGVSADVLIKDELELDE